MYVGNPGCASVSPIAAGSAMPDVGGRWLSMNAAPNGKNLVRHRAHAHASLRRWGERWTWLVWTGLCVLAVWLYLKNPDNLYSEQLRGMVEAETVNIGPVETAQIKAIHVKEGQDVRAGDLLVEMNTALVEHGVTADIIDTIRIGSAFGDTHQDMLQAVSQRQDAIADLEAEVATCEQEWRREEAEFEAMKKEQARRDLMRREGLADETFRTELLSTLANLEKAVEEYPRRIAMLKRQLDTARNDYDTIMTWLGIKEGESLSMAIRRRLNEDAVGERLREAENQAVLLLEAYRLRAPKDGVVSMITFKVGDVVPAGIPILRVVDAKPRRITAYLSESQAGKLPMGAHVDVRSANRRSLPTARAVVDDANPEIHVIAYMADLAGRQAAFRGQRVRLSLRGYHDFIGGETVYLSPESADWIGLILRRIGILPPTRQPQTALSQPMHPAAN